MDTLKSVDQVIERLGGIPELVSLTGSNVKAISAWKSRRAFPSKMYFVMSDALRAKGLSAPASLWKMEKVS